MSQPTPAPDPIQTARTALLTRINSPALKLSGFSADLKLLLDVIDTLDQRCGLLAAAFMQKHYYPERAMHPGMINSIAIMSEHAAQLHRIGVHDDHCDCFKCALAKLPR